MEKLLLELTGVSCPDDCVNCPLYICIKELYGLTAVHVPHTLYVTDSQFEYISKYSHTRYSRYALKFNRTVLKELHQLGKKLDIEMIATQLKTNMICLNNIILSLLKMGPNVTGYFYLYLEEMKC